MTASRPLGRIRGKDRVNWPRKLKERDRKPNGLLGKNDSQ